MKNVIPMLSYLFLCLAMLSCGGANKSDSASQAEKEPNQVKFTHVNGKVHDPCSSCSKLKADSSGQNIIINDFAYFQPSGSKEILLCFNNNGVDFRSGKIFKAELSRLIRLRVGKFSYAFRVAYDLCENGNCSHNHPPLSADINVNRGRATKKMRGIIKNIYTNDDLYTDDMTYGLVTLDTATSYAETTFILVNNNQKVLKENDAVKFKVAELTASVGGKNLSFFLAFDPE